RKRAPASAPPCCRACRRTADGDGRSTRGHEPRLPARRLRIRCGLRDPRRARAACWRALHPEPFDDAAVLEMFLDDLVDVGLVDVGVPDRFRVDDDAGAFLAAVEAARLVDADLAFAGETELLHPFLGVVAHRRRALAVAAGPVRARVTLIAAKENVLVVVGHAGF